MLRTVPAARLAAAGWKGWNKMAKQITAIIVGAGHRALLYSTYALENPQALKIVGVADPDPIRRRKTAEMHGVGEDMCFESCEYSCRMRNPEREAGKSCFSLQTALQSRFSGAFEAENDENGCISAPRLK